MDYLVSLFLFITGFLPFAYGSQGIQQLSPFKTVGSRVELASTTAGFRIPSLANLGCIGTDADGDFGSGSCSGGGGSGTVSTSTNETAGQLAFWSSNSGTPARLNQVATTTLTATSPLSLSNPVVKVGGSNSVLTIATSTLFGAGTPGQVLGWDGTKTVWVATSTCIQITGSADLCDGSDATGAGAAYPFTPLSNYAVTNSATSSVLWAQAGINASSTSHFQGIHNFNWVISTSTTVCAYQCHFSDIQTAINNTPAGGRVDIKAGTYTISSSLTAPVEGLTVCGVGEGTVIQFDGATLMYAIKNAGTIKTHVTFCDMKIQSTSVGSGVGVLINAYKNATFRNLRIVDTNIGIAGTTTSTFYNTIDNVIAEPEGGGVSPGNFGFYLEASSNDNKILNSRVIPSTTGSTTAVYLDAAGTIIDGGDYSDAGIGVDVSDDAHNTKILNNWIEANYTGIRIASGVKTIIIEGNQLSSSKTADITDNGGTGVWRCNHQNGDPNCTFSGDGLEFGIGTTTPANSLDLYAATVRSRLDINGGGAGHTQSALSLNSRADIRGMGTYFNDIINNRNWFSGIGYSTDAFVVNYRPSAVLAANDDSANPADADVTNLLRIETDGRTGIASSTPWGFLSINPPALGTRPAFVIGSSTRAVFQISGMGAASTTALTVDNLNAANCDVKASTSGVLSCGTDATGGGGSFPFSTDTNYDQLVYSTSTPTLWFKSGLFASSTSHLVNASTTQLTLNKGYVGSVGTIYDDGSDHFIIDSTASTYLLMGDPTFAADGWIYADADGASIGNADTSFFNAVASYAEILTPNKLHIQLSGSRALDLDFTNVTGSTNNYLFPDASGTLCLTSTCATFAYPFPDAGNATSTLTRFFGGASTTLLSANFLEVGGTATTTLHANGNITARLGSNGIAQLNDASNASAIWGINGGLLGQSGLAQLAAQGSTHLTFNTGATRNGMTAGTERMRVTAQGFIGVGTTTPRFTFQIASSTAPQLALSDTSLTSNHWTFRSINNYLYVATASPSTYATSTLSAFSIDPNGVVSIQNLNAANCDVKASTAGVLSCGTDATGAGGSDPFTHPAAGHSATTSLMLLYGQASSTQLSANRAYFGATATTTITEAGSIGISTSTPWSALSLGTGGGTSGFAITVTEDRRATSTTPTIDWKNGNQQLYRHGTSATTFTFSNYTDGQQLKLIICNPASGTAGTITWPLGIRWPGGVAPAQTTTANKCDVWSFIATMATSSLVIFGAATSNF